MNGVMDSIQVQSLSAFSQVGFACGCTVFSFYTHFQVLFGGVGYNFAQQFCEFSSMFSFFESSFFPVQADFRIAFAESYAAHCQVHTNFGAFAVEVSAQVSFDIFRNVGSDAYNVLGSPAHFSSHFLEFGSGSAALRAFCRSSFAFIYITTYLTYKFFHISSLHVFILHCLILFLTCTACVPLTLI